MIGGVSSIQVRERIIHPVGSGLMRDGWRWNGSPVRFVGPSVSIFVDMFLPSRRHLEDERNRLEWTRDQEGLGDPHRGPIDLDSGSVTIKAVEYPDGEGDNAEPKDTEPNVTKPAAP